MLRAVDHTKRIRMRMVLPALVLAAAGVTLVVRLWAMQVRDHERYLDEARARYVRPIVIPGKRGEIEDSKGRPLAVSKTCYRLAVNPNRCPDAPAFFADLCAAVELSPAEVVSLLEGSNRYRILAANLDKTRADLVRSVARSWRAHGVSLEPVETRFYPNGRLAAHVLGFVNSVGEPLAGLELSQHELLKGSDGLIEGPTDSRGFVLPWHRTRYVAPAAGKSIRLTIDLDIQQAVTEAVLEVAEKHTPSTIAVVVMDPYTGDILAMVSWPDFDPNKPSEALKVRYRSSNSAPLRNSCVSLAFPPGSVFKVFTVAAALNCGAISPRTTTYCQGVRKFGGRDTRCAIHDGKRAHGLVDPYTAIVRSCNLSAGEYAHKLGARRLVDFVHELGCLDVSRVGLPGETRGLLDPPEKWGNPQHQLAVLGFGQSIALTPLALTAAMCAIANGGNTIRPRLIASVNGTEMPIRTGKQVISPEVAGLVRKMLIGVVEDPLGTGHMAAVPGFHVGGKTGTAQRLDPVTKRISRSLYDSYFVGLVPAENARAVVTVLVDEPQNGYYGGVVAAPVFQKIASYLVTHWRLRPDSDSAVREEVTNDLR